MYTTEEATDIVRETAEIIETADGNKITIPDKEHAKGRSEKMTKTVSEKIKAPDFAPVTQTIMQPTVINEEDTVNVPELLATRVESPFVPSKDSVEYMNDVKVIRDNAGAIINMDEINEGVQENTGALTLAVMEKMDTSELLKIINEDMDMIEALQTLPGKNTNKKCREIIFASQEGRLMEYVAALLPKPEVPQAGDQSGKPPENVSAGEIPINKDFDNQGVKKNELFPGELEKNEVSSNKYEIEVPPFDKGQSRDFATVKTLFNKMMGVHPQITTPRYMELALKLGFLERFSDKEKFCRDASIAEINLLLDSN
jgi:hypothetical protein